VSSRLPFVALLAIVPVLALAACGARTGLLAGGSSSGSSSGGSSSGSGSSGSSSSGAGSSSGSPSCTKPLWLLFNLDDGTSAGSGIYAMRADGTGGHIVPLPHAPARNASISPDGTTLLYTTYMTPDVDGGVDSTLYAYDLAAGTAKAIVTTTDLTYSALSPDGRTVSYVSGFTLRAIDADGSNDRALLVGDENAGTAYGHPVFEPDSRTVVYGTQGAIGSIEADGTNNQTLLEAIPGSFQYPNPGFSPDYQQIVVGLICDEGSPYTLSVYPFASLPGASCQSGRVLTTNITEGASPNSANDPSWGTNGLIAYASYPDVFVIDPDGGDGGAGQNVTAGLTGDAGAATASDPVWLDGCAQVP
jgi:Tol biopolymer transport system component